MSSTERASLSRQRRKAACSSDRLGRHHDGHAVFGQMQADLARVLAADGTHDQAPLHEARHRLGGERLLEIGAFDEPRQRQARLGAD
jgi:hypothetical protein